MYFTNSLSFAISFVNVIPQVLAQVQYGKECFDGPSFGYNGTFNYTRSNVPCQRWDVRFPHTPQQLPRDGGHHNYCRNPFNDLRGLWCYTTDEHKRWDYCGIQKCPDDSLVVWTNYDWQNNTAHILSMHADPEVVKTATDKTGVFNVSILVASNKTFTEFWSLTGDYKHQRLYYTDYRSEYIGIRNLKQNKTLKRFEGMAHGIENMAYDWVTKNLYWSDSEFYWVMVVESTFSYYTPVYRSDRDPVHALALHAKLRKLYFSTYRIYNSAIICTDLAGKNPRKIFEFPAIFDVTGITIDYTDDRLYFTDFTGYGALLISSSLQGTEKKVHYDKKGSVFWSVAAYSDYIYLTDIHEKSTENSNKFYSVWVASKSTEEVFRYTLAGRPRTIAVLSKYEERSFDKASSIGECGNSSLPGCDHICLPRIGHQRECACSLGYQLHGETTCVAESYSDEFLLVADSGQGRIFQVPFNYDVIKSPCYSVIPPSKKTAKATTVTSDPKSGSIYWSDRRFNSIKTTKIGDSLSPVKSLSTSNYASDMAVDPCSKNIFLLNSNTQTIKVMSPDGRFEKTLMQTEDLEESDVRAIALDSMFRKIYWTDTKNVEKGGEVWRMNYDGTEKELVYKHLHWPRGITLDYSDRDGTGVSLFISEAKTAMIFEIPLKMLQNISSTSTKSIPKQYDLAAHIGRDSFHILDIKVHNGILYFMDGKHINLEKFNLTEGPASLTTFGPAEFFAVASISVFSKRDVGGLAACSRQACSNATCNQLCVEVGGPGRPVARCLCNDQMTYLDGKNQTCSGMTPTDNPPSAGDTCPEDINYYVSECADHVIPDWPEPVWANATTQQLVISRPNVPDMLLEGQHRFTYSATNRNNLTTICSFEVKVKVTRCQLRPTLPSFMLQTSPTCGLQFGSAYHVLCKDGSMTIHHEAGSVWRKNITNFCSSLGQWTPITDFSELTCETDVHLRTEHGGLSEGVTIVVTCSAFLFAALIVLVLFRTRNRFVWKINHFKLPIYWKQNKNKTHHNHTSSTPYSAMG